MGRQKYDLVDILNIPRWEAVQDELAKITGTAIITVDYKGIPITKHSLCTDFCKIIRANPVSRKRCYKCDALAGLEAVRLNKPFIYLCHCGIVDVACPVTVDDSYLGAVMFGQVRIPNGDPEGKVERLVSEISSFQPESEQARRDLLELYNKIPEMEFKRIEDIAELISSIVEYIVNSSVDDRVRSLTYEWMLRSTTNEYRELNNEAQIEGLAAEKRADYEMDSGDLPVTRSSPLYPALFFIENHLRQAISMQEMADLCKLSSSYFSRLFTREVGESFKDYLNRRKMDEAKDMLRNTNISIAQIAENLSFSDSSYFVKTFKRFEGITPSVYRRHKYR